MLRVAAEQYQYSDSCMKWLLAGKRSRISERSLGFSRYASLVMLLSVPLGVSVLFANPATLLPEIRLPEIRLKSRITFHIAVEARLAAGFPIAAAVVVNSRTGA